MSSPAGRAARWGRAVVLTAVAVSLAGLAHVVAGGREPSPAALALAAFVLVVPTAALNGLRSSRWPSSRWTTVGGLVLAQALLHLWFSATGGPGCTLTANDLPRRAAAALATLTSSLPLGFAPAPTAKCVHDVTTTGARGTALTLLCHLTAVVITGLVLQYGEATLRRLVDRVRPSYPTPFAAAPVVAAPRVADRSPCRASNDPLLPGLRRRGPPLVLVAA